MSPSIKPETAKKIAKLWRLQTLRLSRSTFWKSAAPSILSREFAGSQLYLDVSRSNAQRLLYVEGERFVEERSLVERLVGPGMTVVDVGANIGYFALLFYRHVGPQGRIICFEPEPANVEELKRNQRRNGLENVEVVEVAVGAQKTKVAFAKGKNGKVKKSGSLTVPQVTIDDQISEPVDMIKIDVEGYEGAVLEGAERTISSYHPSLLVEIHPWLSTEHTYEDIFGYLENFYYSVEYYEVNLSDLRSKVAYHYFGNDPVVKIQNRNDLLVDCMGGRRRSTFWAVCRG